MSENLALISKAADCIALGDIVEKTIRNQNSWNLLPVQVNFSYFVTENLFVFGYLTHVNWNLLSVFAKVSLTFTVVSKKNFKMLKNIQGERRNVNVEFVFVYDQMIYRPCCPVCYPDII